MAAVGIGPAPHQRRWRIEGMDCAGCARTIEQALARLEGVEDIKLAYATGLLEARVGAAEHALEVEVRLDRLGYTALPLESTSAGTVSTAADADLVAPASASAGWWWRDRKLRPVLVTGGLLALAWLAGLNWPGFETPAFTLAAAVGMAPFAWTALRRARAGVPFTIETLMSVAAIGAVAIGAAAEAAVVVFLFALGELLESYAAGRARAGIAGLAALQPRTARRIDVDGRIEEVPSERLAPGEIILVRPGDRVPADGVVVEGVTSLDQSPLTGESAPVAKTVGDTVLAGSVNAEGAIQVRVERGAADNAIARIRRLVEQALASKSPTERFIDRFSRWYTPAAMAAALLVALVPPLTLGGEWSVWIYRALALLLIACPCALVLSTPAAIASGLAAGARRGLLLKGGAALETVARAGIVAFDKTGTLTLGRPVVTDVVPLRAEPGELLALAAAAERGSAHPIARAILAHAEAKDVPDRPAREAAALPGQAVHARVDGRRIWVGSPRFAAQQASLPVDIVARLSELEDEGKTAVVVLDEAGALGLIAVRDEPRPDARAALAALRRHGVVPVMLTGDNRRTGAAIGAALGVEVRAELLPDAKLAEIARLRAGRTVAMVGDGINDAPALAAADVGIAMGSGTDIALETADAALVRDRLHGVAELVVLARATLANVRQNIGVALGLKGVFLITSLAGVTSLWMAILADTGATVLVTLNALRLLRFTDDGDRL